MQALDLNFIKIMPAYLDVLHRLQNLVFDRQQWAKEELAKLLKTPTYSGYLALSGEDPLGFIVYQRVLDQVDIVTIGVLKEYRKQKIASRLLSHMIDELKRDMERFKIFIEVSVESEEAISFYLKHDFNFISRRPEYYRIGDKYIDASVGVLDIGDSGDQ